MEPFKYQSIPNFNQATVPDMYDNLMGNAPPVSYESLSRFGVAPQQIAQIGNPDILPNINVAGGGAHQSLLDSLFPNTGGSLNNVNPVVAGGGGLFGDLFGGMSAKDLSTGMNALTSGAKLLLGMKQYGLAKDQLDENKRRYYQNYNAQRTTTNAQLEDQQRARVASNPGAYQSVDAYMNKNRIV